MHYFLVNDDCVHVLTVQVRSTSSTFAEIASPYDLLLVIHLNLCPILPFPKYSAIKSQNQLYHPCLSPRSKRSSPNFLPNLVSYFLIIINHQSMYCCCLLLMICRNLVLILLNDFWLYMMWILQIHLENISVASGVASQTNFYYNTRMLKLHDTYFLLAWF